MGAEVMEGGDRFEEKKLIKNGSSRLRIRIKPPREETTSSATAEAAKPVAEQAAGIESSTCPECGKSFSSDKALFGHLRCHPERDYRGAAPPPATKNKKRSPSPSPPRAPVKWPTAKRGRKAPTFSDDDGGGDDPVAAIAATILIYISAGKRPPRSDFDELDEYLVPVSSCKRIKKAKKIKDLEFASSSTGSAKDRRPYVCTICFKTFPSHQALGGHRASHNKMAKTSNAANNGEEPGNEAAAAVSEHRCKSCNLSFNSGQALGGHQRRHFNEAAAQHGAHRASTSSPPPCTQSNVSVSRGSPSPSELQNEAEPARHGLLEIDLNEIPCLELEETELKI